MPASISALNIHPLKSGAIHQLSEARIGPFGLHGDRLFMVIDQTGTLVTQRNAGKERLALIRAELTDTELTLTAPDMRPLTLALHDGSRVKRNVMVHDTPCIGLDCGAEASAWLTGFVGEQNGAPVELVQFDATSHRSLNRDWYTEEGQGTAFADGSPVLVASQESLDELNRRISEAGAVPIPMSRLRPNLVLASLPRPFDEDDIDTVAFNDGQVELRFVKPCERCPVPTIDQDTGKRGVNPAEPLRTLATFRRGRELLRSFPNLPETLLGKVFFGMGAIFTRGEGQTLRVGDAATLKYREPRG